MLFQKAPKDYDEALLYKPCEIPPDKVLDMDEKEWYLKIYKGDIPQLTIRSVLMGSALGFFLAFTNLYIGLKTGWALGVAITAAIIAFAIWNFLLKLKIAKSPMTILETNAMQSTASAAGYSTGGTMVSAICALLMLSATPDNPQGTHLPWWVLSLWTLFLAALGTLIAIPMKRNMINTEKLKFPSGTAAAVTLYSLYSQGNIALQKAKALFISLGIGIIFPLLLELNIIKTQIEGKIQQIALLPSTLNIFDGWLPVLGQYRGDDGVLNKCKPSDWTMVLDSNPIMIAAGMIIGMRVSIYMLLSALSLIFIIGPYGLSDQWINAHGDVITSVSVPWKAWRELGLWLGVSIMVSSAILSFLMQWQIIVKTFKSFKFNKNTTKKNYQDNYHNQIIVTEIPLNWFITGILISGSGITLLAHEYFEIPWFYGISAVILSFFLSLVACRTTGESDITPVGAMGKIMQLTYGILIPQSTTANLMTASITASSAGSSADLLNDLKSGYLLGANPRRQFMAQFLGIFSGTAATVIGFYLLVPDATTLIGVGKESPKFPAPAAQAWKAVAELFKYGISNMHPTHLKAIYIGLALGIILVLLEQIFKKYKSYLPSATGIGLGLILPFQYPFSIFIGALISWIWNKYHIKSAENYLIPISAGLIAGISIMGVIVAILNNLIFT